MYCHQGNMGLFRDDYTLHIALISFKKKNKQNLKPQFMFVLWKLHC